MRALVLILGVSTLIARAAPPERAEVTFAYVRDRAVRRAAEPFRPADAKLPPRVAALSYDDYRKVEFRRESALWAGDKLPFRVHLFARSGAFPERVALHEFSATHVQPIPFNPSYYKLGAIDGLSVLPEDLGYAGLKILHPLNRPEAFDELIAFVGASYFRALGQGHHYGLSARGLALDSGLVGRTEEFPRFSEFWVGKPQPKALTVTLYALLESPSATGAFEFVVTPGKSTFVDVRAALIFRPYDKLPGLAPLTSMFWYGENTDRPAGEMRPEVHDSDGLLVRDDTGTQYWRPLRGVRGPETMELPVQKLVRFGLLQRDRCTGSYEDREAQYERRPTAWIEPREGWQGGTVHLVELTAHKEYGDNIVAYWSPAERPQPGQPYEYRYRIVWSSAEPPDAPAARVHATREGLRMGDRPGRLFWIDFVDSNVSKRNIAELVPELEVAGAKVAHQAVLPYPEIGGWRVALELEPPDTPGATVELRCRLRDNDGVFSETWLYRWKP